MTQDLKPKMLARNLFQVNSKTKDGVIYTVDMTIGRCECFSGKDGSICFHQYYLWSKGFASSLNFLPKFDVSQRKKFAEIAIGDSLDSSFYEPLHSKQNETLQGENELSHVTQQEDTDFKDKVNELKDHFTKDEVNNLSEQALEMFKKFCYSVEEEIKNENKDFNSALIKFMKRYETFGNNQRVSSLQSFGTSFFGRKRSKIKVQPTAVSRRKSKIGSRQKQSNVALKSLPNRPVALKRKHSMKEIVEKNVPPAKKAGRSMISNTKYFNKKTGSKVSKTI